MNRNNLIALAAITLTVVVTAVVVVSKERAPMAMDEEPLLPALVENVNQAAVITLASNRDKTILEYDGETWRIANSDDYPALFEKVRALLINLTELRTLERKTNNPDLYSRLQVQDPAQKDSNSVRVTVTGTSKNVLADVIIGKPRISKVTSLQTGLYVRRFGDEHAMLVSGQVPVSAQKTAWFNNDILNIASERVHTVTIRHADGSELRAVRDDPGADFEFESLPANREVQSQTALNRFRSVLQEIKARDIHALESFEFGPDTVETTVHTFDGLVATVRSLQQGDQQYASFQFSHDAGAAQHDNALDSMNTSGTDEQGTPAKPQSVATEVHDLQQQLSGWVYEIPEYQYDVLAATLDEYTRVNDQP